MTSKESSPASKLVDSTMDCIIQECETERWFLGTVNARDVIRKHIAHSLTALEAENARLRGHIVEARKILCEPQDETVRLVGASTTLAQAITEPQGGDHGE